MTLPILTRNNALFLDIDGTLIDLAPTPDSVIVPPGLPERLHRLRDWLGGALAILSGRKLADIDRLLGPDLPCAAEHGMLIRDPAGTILPLVHPLTHYESWRALLRDHAATHPGILIEEKKFSLVIHYRQVPAQKPALEALASQLAASDPDCLLLPAHCAFELRPQGGGKAEALNHFLTLPPFTHKTPIFIGDDTTDEPAIAEANNHGGRGLHVARDFGGTTEAVRRWLGM